MKFWLDNRTTAEYELTNEEIREKFLLWGEKNTEKLGAWTLDRCLRDFMTAPRSASGLSSIYEDAGYKRFITWLRPQNVYVLVAARVNAKKFPVDSS